MPLRLVSHPLCPYVQRAVITLSEKSAAFERIDIDLADKPPWFLAISPLGKVPVLQTTGHVIFESAVICEYLDETIEPQLHPADPLERARHRAWIEHASATLVAIAALYRAPDSATLEQRRHELRAKFAWVERALGAGPWFAGDRFSLVDAAYAPALRYIGTMESVTRLGLLEETPLVREGRERLLSRPSVQRAVSADYPAQLRQFLAARSSEFGRLARSSTGRAATTAAEIS
jgi:glutathione S-transferase